ncbi:MAG: hypothetical protein ACLP5O_18510 [Acidimicrobiales bacterium]
MSRPKLTEADLADVADIPQRLGPTTGSDMTNDIATITMLGLVGNL